MISDDIQGYAAVDGMNECGLVVNAPYDTSATYAKPDPTLLHGNISISNWPQYILDSFADAAGGTEYARHNQLYLIEEHVPEGGNAQHLVSGNIHLTVSDKHGYSVILEINNGEITQAKSVNIF